jgi:hypothetical protein
MKEFAIYGWEFESKDIPLGGVAVDGPTVTVVGPEDFVAKWATYFSEWDTWPSMFPSRTPLRDLLAKSTYPWAAYLGGEENQSRFDEAMAMIDDVKTKILKNTDKRRS